MVKICFLVILLVTGYQCAPREFGGGFRIGGQSRSDFAAGANGVIRRDGLVLSGDGDGMVGAKWKGGAFGGGYLDIDKLHLAGRGAASTALGGKLDGGLGGKLGLAEDGSVPLGLNGRVGAFKQAELGANGKLAFGEDATDLSQLYRRSEFENPHMNF